MGNNNWKSKLLVCKDHQAILMTLFIMRAQIMKKSRSILRKVHYFLVNPRVPFPIGEQKYAEFTFPQKSIQYVRFLQNPLYVFEINGKKENEWVTDRSKWHGSFTFYHPAKKVFGQCMESGVFT